MEFEDLPLEVIFEIFSKLTQKELELYAAPVCPQWKKIAEDPIFRENVNLDGSKETQDEIVNEIKRSYLVRNLMIKNMSNWGWLDCSPQLDVLKQIRFAYCEMSSLIMSKIVDLCSNVQLIEFTGENYDFNIDVVRQIVRWENLRCLKLDLLPEICDGSEFLNVITEKCEHLREIDISWDFDNFTDESFVNFIKRRGANLTSLNLSFANLTNKSFMKLPKCSNLTHLSIFTGELATDADLMHIKSLKSLQYLAMTECWHLTAKGFQRFFREACFPHLKMLLLNNCLNFSNKSARAVGIGCPALEEIYLTDTCNISENGIRAIISKCKKLKGMFLNGLNQIDGSCLQDISSQLPDLKMMYIRNCVNVTYPMYDHICNRNMKLCIKYSRSY